MDEKSASLQKAMDFLQKNIDENAWLPGQRLPPIKVLARQAFVRCVSMSEAIATIDSLTVVGSKGVFVKHEQIDTFPIRVKAPAQKWEQIRATISREILEGVFSTKEYLPSRRELKNRYGISLETVQKALTALQNDGIIAREQWRYRITNVKNTVSNSCIVFISSGNGNGNILIFNDRIKEALTKLELELENKKIQLITLGVDPTQKSETFQKKLTGTFNAISSTILGFILWPAGEATHYQVWVAAIRAMNGPPVPLALIDEFGTLSIPQLAVLDRRLGLVFSIAGETAGKEVATRLLKRGHRHVAYFSLAYTQAWSRFRLAGMQSAFAKNGFGDAITVLHKADDSVENETQSKFATLQNRLIDLMNEFVHDAPLSIMEFHLRTNIHMIFGAEENYLILKPLFKKALTDTTISAWITENEAGALCAYYFLNIDTQIPREKQPTLIFFDNDRRLASYNVSNYNFSFASIVEKALTYILNPRHEYYWNKTRIECEGFFVERGNMAAAR